MKASQLSLWAALVVLPEAASLLSVDTRGTMLHGAPLSRTPGGLRVWSQSSPLGGEQRAAFLTRPVQGLRGGSGLMKKLGAKNAGLLMVLLSILYTPRAMLSCAARATPQGRGVQKIQKLGCGVFFLINNIITLTGLALVLVNSRKFDRYGRSKFR